MQKLGSARGEEHEYLAFGAPVDAGSSGIKGMTTTLQNKCWPSLQSKHWRGPETKEGPDRKPKATWKSACTAGMHPLPPNSFPLPLAAKCSQHDEAAKHAWSHRHFFKVRDRTCLGVS